MNLNTLIRYLLFDRQAIDQIANGRQAIWAGLAFALLASIARDYDGIYLMGQPWHLLVPAVASFVLATLLFGFLRLFPSDNPRISFRQFLTYFWLMSPMAWIYAIPVERFLSPLGAAQTNFWFLVLVATWRVLLICRVVTVREQTRFSMTLMKVLFLSDTVVLIALQWLPLPVFSIMGGIRLSERDAFISGMAFLTYVLGSLLWIILFFINLTWLAESWGKKYRSATKDHSDSDDLQLTLTATLDGNASQTDDMDRLVGEGDHSPSTNNRPSSKSVWVLIAILSVVSVVLMIIGQPEQRRRDQAEKFFGADQIVQGLEYMSLHPQADFPPHWTIPTSNRTSQSSPHPVDVAYESLNLELRPWVQAAAIQRFTNYFQEFRHGHMRWLALDEIRFDRAIKVLELADDLDPPFLETTYTDLSRFIDQYPDRWQTEKLKNFLNKEP